MEFVASTSVSFAHDVATFRCLITERVSDVLGVFWVRARQFLTNALALDGRDAGCAAFADFEGSLPLASFELDGRPLAVLAVRFFGRNFLLGRSSPVLCTLAEGKGSLGRAGSASAVGLEERGACKTSWNRRNAIRSGASSSDWSGCCKPRGTDGSGDALQSFINAERDSFTSKESRSPKQLRSEKKYTINESLGQNKNVPWTAYVPRSSHATDRKAVQWSS